MEMSRSVYPFTYITFPNPDAAETPKHILPPTKSNNVISIDRGRLREENEIGFKRIGLVSRGEGRFTLEGSGRSHVISNVDDQLGDSCPIRFVFSIQQGKIDCSFRLRPLSSS